MKCELNESDFAIILTLLNRITALTSNLYIREIVGKITDILKKGYTN
jgi:hypothetical protein